MEVNPPILLAYVGLAHDFLIKIYWERFKIKKSTETDDGLLIDGLLDKLDRKVKEDRALAKNLKVLKQLLAKCNPNQSVTDELRTVLLDCGLDSAVIDSALAKNEWPKQDICINEQQSVTEEVMAKESPAQSKTDEPVEVRANRLKEEGNKFYMEKNYKNAVLNYNEILAMPDLPGDIFVKAAANQMAALVAWDGTTAEMIKDSKLKLEQALLIDMNSKLFYRYAEGQIWLGDLSGADHSLHLAQRLKPDDEEIRKLHANVKQNRYYEATAEHLDEKYRPKSESETKQKLKIKFPNVDLNIVDKAVKAGLPLAFVVKGHIERDHNKDYIAAARWYERAGKAGEPEGLLNLAHLYTLGLGVKQDVCTAVDLLKRAVKFSPKKTGMAECYCALGMKYMRGTGVDADIKEAKLWFQKAADLGNADGELNLGFVLKLEKKYLEAIEAFKSAAVKGSARAYANLGDMFRDGLGVKKDVQKAQLMYDKAVANGYSLNVEDEMKQKDIYTAAKSFYEQDQEMARLETINVEMTDEALLDLEDHAPYSEVARSILLGFQNYYQGARILFEMETSEYDDYILEMFSSAIQSCGHFLTLTDDAEYYLTRVVDDVLENGTKVNPTDLAVCGLYLRYPLSELPNVMKTNSYFAARSALELNKLNDKPTALQIINWAISKDPKNPDLRFYKARITQSIDNYCIFTKLAPLDHYWSPKAYFCIATLLMEEKPDVAFKAYNIGLSAEKRQLVLFQGVDIEEKREVASYLMSKKILNRCPPCLKITSVRRKELIVHHHNQMKNIFEQKMVSGYTLISPAQHTQQPDPTVESCRKEVFFEDMDFSKEKIYEGFTDCLILVPPLKITGVVAVVEDKQGNTSRVQLYEDISLIHIKVGQWIRLHNPYVQLSGDDRASIKVTNKNCFEILHFEYMCHYCTEPEADEQFIWCDECEDPIFCSQKCFEKHWHDYQHKVVCPYIKIEHGIPDKYY